MSTRKYRLPPDKPSFDDGNQRAIATPPSDPQGQFDDGIPSRSPDQVYRGARRIGIFTEYDMLKRHRKILRTAISKSPRTLGEFIAVIPSLSDWLKGETPLGAQQRFDAVCLCDTLKIKVHDAFPDLRIDYHA